MNEQYQACAHSFVSCPSLVCIASVDIAMHFEAGDDFMYLLTLWCTFRDNFVHQFASLYDNLMKQSSHTIRSSILFRDVIFGNTAFSTPIDDTATDLTAGVMAE